jgi:large subunit ribosomal protein L13
LHKGRLVVGKSLNLSLYLEKAMKTFSANKETAQHNWFVVDAADKTLGRLAAGIAHRLRGKHKPEYTAHVDTGDYIVVINAEKVTVTGTKARTKLYHRHSTYCGGHKTQSFNELIARSPEDAIKLAVKGMIPRTPLGRDMMGKLKIYAGDKHPHAAQQPAQLTL